MDSDTLKSFAADTLLEELRPYINEVKEVFVNAARDTLESIITGRRTLDEWAKIAIRGVDKVKAQVIRENGWEYIGGKLNFKMSDKSSHKVVISFELYYQDEDKKWRKVGAGSDMYASNFTLEAIEEIKSQGMVSFEVD